MPSVLWLVVMMTPQTFGIAYSCRFFSSTRSTSGGAAVIGFHVIVEGKAVELAEIARLADAQDHRFQEAIEAAEHCCGETSVKFHGPIGVLDRLQQRVLADALLAAEHERVVDLLVQAAARGAHTISRYDRIVAIQRCEVI